MYSLTIHFGPNAVCWAFLFKDKEKADAYLKATGTELDFPKITIEDDFGQTCIFDQRAIHGALLEDLEAVETARIQRSLAEERCKVKLMNAAKTDPVIGPAMRGAGAQVLAPNFRQ